MSALSPTVPADSPARDHLPPAEPWPPPELTMPLRQDPERLNAAVETQYPRQVRFVTALPLTTSGRPQHPTLRQLSESENRA